jgi:TRAP-type C4-dicarboxylate transport system permease small subunit
VTIEATSRPRASASGGLLATIAFVLGSAGLLAAMAGDVAAVIGRHLGIPFLGSIEIVQAAIVVAASSAMVGATLSRAHATVHIVTERLSAPNRRRFQRAADSLSALVFAALAAGSIWLAIDLWNGAESTELLGLPVKALRLVWCASAGIITSLFVTLAFRTADRTNGA